MSVRALVVCEARADFAVASELADRVAVERTDWLEREHLDDLRAWAESEPDTPYLAWRDLKKAIEARGYRIRPRSRFGGQPGAPDAKAAEKALQFALREGGYHAVFLIRDSDGDPTRGQGLEQARTHDRDHPWPFAVILGLAQPKREAWVIAGFEPGTDEEREALARMRHELGLNPCDVSHALAARPHGGQREAKRVLAVLVGDDDAEREAACWRETSLDILRSRGRENGLAAYLDEVEAEWLPRLGTE
jgi:hypothetical protein